MEAISNQGYMVNNYWGLLKDLSDSVKLALISKLSISLAEKVHGKEHTAPFLSDFYGSMANVPFPSSEEIRDVMKDEDMDISRFCL